MHLYMWRVRTIQLIHNYLKCKIKILLSFLSLKWVSETNIVSFYEHIVLEINSKGYVNNRIIIKNNINKMYYLK